MKTVNVCKAQGIGNQEVESITIVIDKEHPRPPTGAGWEPQWREALKKEAVTLAEALFSSLSGGVLDALLVELLDRKRSMFIVPSWEKEDCK
jgi:hypothetical protein